MLVGDLTDDFFDDVLEGDDAGDAAVLVDDDGHLQALVAQLDHEGADRHGLGNRGRVGHEGRGDDGDLGTTIGGHGDRAAQRDQAEDVVGVVPDHGESGVSRFACQVENVLGAVALAEGMQAAAVGHDVGGAEGGHADRVDEEVGRRHVEGALFDGVLDEGGQLRGGARRGDLLLGLDAHAGEHPVRGSTEHPDDGARDGGEGHLEGHDAHSGGQGVRQGEVLGNELAEEHREDVDEGGGHECRDAGGQPPGEARRPEEVLQQASQRALRRVAEQDRGQRNAHLRTRQLGGQGSGGAQDGGGAAVPFLSLLLEDGLIDRDKRKLGGDEDEGAGGQDDAEQKHEGGRHRVAPSTRPGRLAGTRTEEG